MLPATTVTVCRIDITGGCQQIHSGQQVFDLKQVDHMRAFFAFAMLMVSTLSASAVDVTPSQTLLNRLPGAIGIVEASITRNQESDNGHVNLRTRIDRSRSAGIETQDLPKHAGQTTANQVIGWREHIILPELGSAELDAKIDTGARTSALHAVDLTVENRDGEEWVSFHIPYLGKPRSVRHSAKVVDRRKIRNTSGIAQVRHVIKTTLVLGGRQWQIEVSLADREKMKHDIILGRTAVRDHGLLVDPAKSYLAGTPITGAPAKPPSRL